MILWRANWLKILKTLFKITIGAQDLKYIIIVYLALVFSEYGIKNIAMKSEDKDGGHYGDNSILLFRAVKSCFISCFKFD